MAITLDYIINKYRPFYTEIAETGVLATLVVAFSDHMSPEMLAAIVVIKGVIKTYLFRNATVKKENDMTILDSQTADYIIQQSDKKTDRAKISLDDRVDHLIDWINDSMVKNGGKRYETKSFKAFVMDILTKDESAIAAEAAAKLTPLQKKALGL